MRNLLLPALGALLLFTGAVQAQDKSADPGARREAMRQAHEKARKACEGKPQDERRACMAREMCAQAQDPKACEARLAKARDAAAKARAACEGKPADERRECMRREMCAQAEDPAKCEARAKAHAEQRAKMRAACEGKQGEELKACLRAQRGTEKK